MSEMDYCKDSEEPPYVKMPPLCSRTVTVHVKDHIKAEPFVNAAIIEEQQLLESMVEAGVD